MLHYSLIDRFGGRIAQTCRVPNKHEWKDDVMEQTMKNVVSGQEKPLWNENKNLKRRSTQSDQTPIPVVKALKYSRFETYGQPDVEASESETSESEGSESGLDSDSEIEWADEELEFEAIQEMDMDDILEADNETQYQTENEQLLEQENITQNIQNSEIISPTANPSIEANSQSRQRRQAKNSLYSQMIDIDSPSGDSSP